MLNRKEDAVLDSAGDATHAGTRNKELSRREMILSAPPR
jgi:hypothetical protein